MTAQSTQSGFSFGQTINDALARVGDLLTFDFLYDRGMVQTPAERQQQYYANDDMAGARSLMQSPILIGGVVLVGIVAALVLLKK